MYFYFDRTTATSWNMLLRIEHELNGKNSFISQFPEFVSYTNTLSYSPITVYSVPNLLDGSAFHPIFKNSSDISYASKLLGKNVKYSDMTSNDFYFYSIYTFTNMLMSNNVKNVAYSSIPYYVKDFSYSSGEMHTLQKNLNDKANMNDTVMDNEVLAYEAFDFKIKTSSSNKLIEQMVFDNLDNNYKFKNTDGAVFNSHFSQVHHNDYNFKENGKYKVSSDTEYYFLSMWQSISTLKDILNRLKEEPFLDSNNKPMTNSEGDKIFVYDKTLFYIVSDHGMSMGSDLNNWVKILNYCVDQNWMTNDEKSALLKNSTQLSFNPTLMIKNFKYDKDNNIIQRDNSNKVLNFFDNNKILTLSDVPLTIQNNLYNYYKINLNKNYFIDLNLFKQSNLSKRMSSNEIASNMYLENPLNNVNNNPENSKRKFILTWPYNWKFAYDEKEFKYSNIKKFEIKDKKFFNSKNITD